jgi:hypothetical protein
MTRRRKQQSLVLGFLLGVGLLVFALYDRRPPPAVAFTGWTNIAGVRHVTFRFPPVLQRGGKNFAYRTYSRIRLDFVWQQADGQETRGFHNEIVGGPAVLATDVAIPVPPQAVGFNVTSAHLWLVRRWDNIRLPWELPSSHWTLATPAVTPPEV